MIVRGIIAAKTANQRAVLQRALRVEPRFDAEITYAEITDDGVVRQPAFKRLVI